MSLVPRCYECDERIANCRCWMNPIVRDEREPPWPKNERADLEPKERPDGRYQVAA